MGAVGNTNASGVQRASARCAGDRRVESELDPSWIFVHPPKTGGTSVTRSIGQDFVRKIYGKELKTVVHSGRSYHVAGDSIHASALKLRECIGQDLWDKKFKFGLVRNPYDRVVSLFHFEFLKRKRQNISPVRSIFKDWLIKRKDNKSFHYLFNLRPFTCWDIFSDGEKLIIDEVYRFETFFENWDEICKKVCGKSRKLFHVHKTDNRKPYQEYYDAESRAFVEEHFQRDLEYWGYEFES